MKYNNLFAGLLLAAVFAEPSFAGEPAAQEPAAAGSEQNTEGHREQSIATVNFQRAFGPAGLLTIWSSNELFGVTQTRINNELAHYVASETTGITTGYRDNVTTYQIPISALIGLSDGHSMLYFDLSLNASRSSKNLTYSTGTIGALTAEYLNMPTSNLAWGIGAMVQTVDTNLKQNDGSVDAPSGGIRADLLYKISDNWAVSNRIVALWGDAETNIPLPFGTLRNDPNTSMVYWQGDFVGTFSNKDFGVITPGWLVHPRLGIVAERSTQNESRNSFGAISDRITIDYSSMLATVRIERPSYGTSAWVPQLEVGVQHEFPNSYSSYAGENDYIYSSLGLGIRLNKPTFLNFNYVRYDGFDGNVRNQVFKTIWAMTF
ncbi:autotransporter domain-containing protein [Azorhizobium doebereinerae]|uniref:autotransporter domain-containing protein n=1 Tax=Azorhizobium doebereinerae TaxID=281091 RepID=UPI0003F60AD2|nr:autotransporter domain-containing protein [Azorhizobium doebereinerae]